MIELQSYSPGDYEPGSFPRRLTWLAVSRVFFETAFPWPSRWKAFLLSSFGGKVGRGLVIKPSVKIKYPWFLEIGDHCWIGERSWIDNVAPVTLADQVVLSQGSAVVTGNHDYRSRSFDLRLEPVAIEAGAWIAAHARVGPGVTVGAGAVLTFGSVARDSLEPGGVYAGNPAERVRERGLPEED